VEIAFEKGNSSASFLEAKKRRRNEARARMATPKKFDEVRQKPAQTHKAEWLGYFPFEEEHEKEEGRASMIRR